ncbi:MAG: 4-hydroxy-tetrahydrodipicolinate reductase [Actinomycetota bacterium]
MIRVGLIGACGRMGRLVARAVADDPGLALVAAIDRSNAGSRIGPMIGRPDLEIPVADELDRLLEADVEVAVDFTHPDVVMENLEFCVSHAIDTVVGTSGFDEARVARVRALIESEGGESNVLVAPNFALGAVLMQRFAAEAARHLPDVEIVELHHDGKADAPSGTAIATAGRIAAAREGAPRGQDPARSRGEVIDGVPIHSVRLPGLVAHQEVIFGGTGETLTIRHDTSDRTSFLPGVLLAIRAVTTLPGLTVGLEPILGR